KEVPSPPGHERGYSPAWGSIVEPDGIVQFKDPIARATDSKAKLRLLFRTEIWVERPNFLQDRPPVHGPAPRGKSHLGNALQTRRVRHPFVLRCCLYGHIYQPPDDGRHVGAVFDSPQRPL